MKFLLYREVKLSADQICSDLILYDLAYDPDDRALIRDEIIDSCKFIISIMEDEE